MVKKWGNIFFGWIAIAVFLILFGSIMFLHSLDQEFQFINDQQDEQLEKIMEAIDETIVGCFHRFGDGLVYETNRNDFVKAEKLWEETGDGELLLYRMSENLVAVDETTIAVVAIEGDEVILSTDGRLDYTFSSYYEERGLFNIALCTDGDGRCFVGLIYKKEKISYACLIPTSEIGNLLLDNTGMSLLDGVYLMDTGETVLLKKNHEVGATYRIEECSEIFSELENKIIYVLKNKIQDPKYDYYGEGQSSRYYHICYLQATDSKNQFFSIVTIKDVAGETVALKDIVFRLIFFGVMITGGILILILQTSDYRKKRSIMEQELEALRIKKNRLEEINQQSVELIRHQKLETLGALSASILHEFNNLLTPIKGYSVMIMERLAQDVQNESLFEEDGVENAEQTRDQLYDDILEIYRAAIKSEEIINQMTAFSRGKHVPTVKKINPNMLMDTVVDIVRPIMSMGICIETDYRCVNTELIGEETTLLQMLLNLVINSFQAMENSGGTLKLSTAEWDEKVIFIVEDNGTGMSDETKEHIFDMFYTTKTGEKKGTGIGMAVVKQVVDDYNGKIQVKSEIGKGTKILIEIPKINKY